MRKKFKLTAKELSNLYTDKEYSCQKIAELHNLNRHTVLKYLSKYGVKRRTLSEAHKFNTCNEDYFSRINTEEKAYWLGFMYADGCVFIKDSKVCNSSTYYFNLSQSELEPLLKFKQSLNATNNIGSTKPALGNLSYRLTISSKGMVEDLIRLGCIPKKSLTLKFPTTKQVPKKYLRHFIRGYFDGDGSVYLTHSTHYYVQSKRLIVSAGICICGTLEFLTELRNNFKFLKNPDKSIEKEQRSSTNTYSFRLSGGNQLRDFYEYLYKDSTVYLQRKKDKFEEYFKEKGSTTIIGKPLRIKKGLRYSLISHENVS